MKRHNIIRVEQPWEAIPDTVASDSSAKKRTARQLVNNGISVSLRGSAGRHRLYRVSHRSNVLLESCELRRKGHFTHDIRQF